MNQTKSIFIDVIANDESADILALQELINNEYYYKYVKSLINNEIEFLKISFGRPTTSFLLSYNALVEILILNHEFSGIEFANYEYLLYEASMENLINKYKDEILNAKVDNKEFNIPIINIINFLCLEDSAYEKAIQENEIYGIDLTTFVYLTMNFISVNFILSRYDLPQKIKSRIYELKSYSIVDYSACNLFLETKDEYRDLIFINQELRTMIFKNMDEDLSVLEKAIYIYIKLCKIFTYDDEYYLEYTQKNYTKHKNIDDLSKINAENNEVVCFEFNAIYGKLLDELGICYESIYTLDNCYGQGHASLVYRVGDYIISADSVKSVIYGDIAKSKVNLPLRGLKTENVSLEQSRKFDLKVKSVYDLIKNEEECNIEICDTKNMSLRDRFEFFLEQLKSSNLKGIDLVFYIFYLRSINFSNEEMNNNLIISCIKNSKPIKKDKLSQLDIIISFKNNNSVIFIIVNSTGEFKVSTQEEIDNLFFDNTFSYAVDNKQTLNDPVYCKERSDR